MLSEPALERFAVGSPQWYAAQREVIASRPLVRRAYDRWYAAMLDDVRCATAAGDTLEIGSGAGYLKTLDPSIVTSDVVPTGADLTVDAQRLPFADASLRAILLTHVFHHVPDVRLFLREAVRTIAPGGVLGMIDVAHTPLARLLFGRFDIEDFYETVPGDWRLDPRRRLDGANQALAWIVFCRDRERFEAEFPQLRIERSELMPWLGYLCSGGVTRRSLVPAALAGAVARLDAACEIANPLCALHWHIRLRRV